MRAFLSGLAVVAWMVAAAGTAQAQAIGGSGNVTIASDYTFRGVSQTLEKPAVQGGLDVESSWGAYAGIWGSSVNFGEDLASGARAQMELDLYGGIAPSVGGFDLDLGFIYYAYPGAASSYGYNFIEGVAGVSRAFGPLSAGLTGAYSPEFFGSSGAALYAGMTVEAASPWEPLSFSGGVGRQTVEDNDAFGTPDYLVWSAALNADVLGSRLGAALTGTSIPSSDCFGGGDLCRARFIASVSRGL